MDTNELRLPKLPEPAVKETHATAKNTRSVRDGFEMGGYVKTPAFFTDDQMLAYARQAVTEALAAKEAELAALKEAVREYNIAPQPEGDMVKLCHDGIPCPRVYQPVAGVTEAMVEAAARELARRDGYDPDEQWQEFDRSVHLTAGANGYHYDDPVIVRWHLYRGSASAALVRALTPSEEEVERVADLVIARIAEHGFDGCDGMLWQDAVRHVCAAIAAAQQEKKN